MKRLRKNAAPRGKTVSEKAWPCSNNPSSISPARGMHPLTRGAPAYGRISPNAWWTARHPGLAGNLLHIAETVLRDPDVDVELPLELGRLYLLLHAISKADRQDEPTQAELRSLIGGRNSTNGSPGETLEDQWFIAARRVEERDRLITSVTWMMGMKTRRWARVLRFAPVPQTIIEPWPLGSTVHALLKFQPGLHPLRAIPENEGVAQPSGLPAMKENPGMIRETPRTSPRWTFRFSPARRIAFRI